MKNLLYFQICKISSDDLVIPNIFYLNPKDFKSLKIQENNFMSNFKTLPSTNFTFTYPPQFQSKNISPTIIHLRSDSLISTGYIGVCLIDREALDVGIGQLVSINDDNLVITKIL